MLDHTIKDEVNCDTQFVTYQVSITTPPPRNCYILAVKSSVKALSRMSDKQGSGQTQEPKNLMTQEDAARIQRATAKKPEDDGEVPKGSFASRAQSTADTRANKQN